MVPWATDSTGMSITPVSQDSVCFTPWSFPQSVFIVELYREIEV